MISNKRACLENNPNRPFFFKAGLFAIIIAMNNKLFYHSLILILFFSLAYAPVSYAGGVVNTALKIVDIATTVIDVAVNVVGTYIINPAINIVTGAGGFLVGGIICGVSGGSECRLYNRRVKLKHFQSDYPNQTSNS